MFTSVFGAFHAQFFTAGTGALIPYYFGGSIQSLNHYPSRPALYFCDTKTPVQTRHDGDGGGGMECLLTATPGAGGGWRHGGKQRAVDQNMAPGP